METFSQRLAYLLDKCGQTQKSVADATDLSTSGLVKYKTDRIPKAEELFRLAKYFNVSMEWFLTGVNSNGNEEFSNENVQLDTDLRHYVRQIPVIGWAHAGQAMTYDEMPEDYLDRLPVPDHLAGKKMIGLIVDGDSMVPEVHNKDKVAVYTEEVPWSGCLVVSKFENDEGVSIRRFQKIDEENVRLIPYNTLYAPTNHHLSEFKWIKPVAFIFRDTTNPNKEN